MRTITHNKLVRDKIPQIIEQAGKSCIYETLPDNQYFQMLNKKLLEEVTEYLESGTVEELADIGEVLYAILVFKNVSMEEYQKIRLDKRNARGGFTERILLKEVIED